RARAIAMAGRNIAYVKPKEPSFLRKFKKDVGFKEGPNVDTKRGPAMMPHRDDDDAEEKEDERPQVVVMKDGDLTEEEARKLQGGASPFVTDDRPADGRILFRKPAKREGGTPDTKASSKSAKRWREGKQEGGRSKKGDSAVKNAKLLSFGEDDDGG
uniref:Zgc:77056 n=1 Tax=Petromyzon marinus TaxID=7757 RepID=S4RPN4_PETMA